MQWWRAGELVLLVAASVGGFSMVEEGQHQQVGRVVGWWAASVYRTTIR